jgi:hypothetical protein
MQYQPKRGERDCRAAVLSMVSSFYYEQREGFNDGGKIFTAHNRSSFISEYTIKGA